MEATQLDIFAAIQEATTWLAQADEADRMKEPEALPGEVWTPIPGYEGIYEISNMIRIRSYARQGTPGKILAQSVNGAGYLCVGLSNNGEKTKYGVHVLVTMTFVGPRPTPQHMVNHKDGNRTNNAPSNLEWVTRSENILHAYRELGARVPVPKGSHLTRVFTPALRAEIQARLTGQYGELMQLAKEYGIKYKTLHSAAHRYGWNVRTTTV